MFELEKTFSFEAGHSLEHHDGKCKKPHGHSYSLTVSIAYQELERAGPQKNMAIDFGEISEIVKPMIQKYFDHCWLNDTLGTDSPTTEFIAKWAYDHLAPSLPNLRSIAVRETETSRATYVPAFEEERA